jgi:hypothetical protein
MEQPIEPEAVIIGLFWVALGAYLGWVGLRKPKQ